MKSTGSYIKEQVVVNIIINFFIALFAGCLTMSSLQNVPMWAPTDAPLDPNMGGDNWWVPFYWG